MKEKGHKKPNIIWLTNVSTSVGAIVGGLWFYLLRGFPCPSAVYLFKAVSDEYSLVDETERSLDVLDKLNRVFCGGRFAVDVIDTKDNFFDYDSDLGNFLKGVLNADALVFDFSPGRKYMAISMVKYLLDIQRGVKEKVGPFKDSRLKDVRILNLFLTRYKELYGRDSLLTDLPIWAFDFIMARNALNGEDIVKRRIPMNVEESPELSIVVPRYKLMNLLNVLAFGMCLDSDDFNECKSKSRLDLSVYSHHFDGAFFEIQLELGRDSSVVKLPFPIVKWNSSLGASARKFDCEKGDHWDFLNVLYMSGVKSPVRYSEIIDKVKEFDKRSPVKGTKPGVITFDTDTFMFQIPYRVARYIEQNRIQNTEILLLNPVKREIGHHLDSYRESKYTKQDLVSLSSLFNTPSIDLDFYLNIECKERRYWWLALQLFKYLEGRSYTSITGENRRGDDAILDAIEKYQNENRSDVVLVTFDAELSDRATSRGIETILLRHPETPSRGEEIHTHWWETMEIIYYASIIFAQIKLNALSKTIHVQGFWRRKDRQQPYTEDTVRIITRSKKLIDLAKKVFLVQDTQIPKNAD